MPTYKCLVLMTFYGERLAKASKDDEAVCPTAEAIQDTKWFGMVPVLYLPQRSSLPTMACNTVRGTCLAR